MVVSVPLDRIAQFMLTCNHKHSYSHRSYCKAHPLHAMAAAANAYNMILKLPRGDPLLHA